MYCAFVERIYYEYIECIVKQTKQHSHHGRNIAHNIEAQSC